MKIYAINKENDPKKGPFSKKCCIITTKVFIFVVILYRINYLLPIHNLPTTRYKADNININIIGSDGISENCGTSAADDPVIFTNASDLALNSVPEFFNTAKECPAPAKFHGTKFNTLLNCQTAVRPKRVVTSFVIIPALFSTAIVTALPATQTKKDHPIKNRPVAIKELFKLL